MYETAERQRSRHAFKLESMFGSEFGLISRIGAVAVTYITAGDVAGDIFADIKSR